MRAESARFTQSPSTAPIRTSEFFMAERRALRLFNGEEKAVAAWSWLPLWRPQRKDPGCVVGEQRQVRRTGERLSAAER